MSRPTDHQIIELHEQGWGQPRIAKHFGCTDSFVRSRLSVNGLAAGSRPSTSKEKLIQADALRAGGMSTKDIARTMGMAQSQVQPGRSSLLEPIKQNYPAIREHRKMLKAAWKPGRYALAGDFHVPFHHPAALDQMTAMKGDFDGCIVAGDLMDFYNKSSFLKDMKITMKQEVAQANAVLDRLTKRFGRVL